jgi:nitrite reductase (NADH) small subunit
MTGFMMTATAAMWMDVCALDDLEAFWGEAALVAGHQVAIVRLPDDRVFAVGNLDPIAGAHVMSRGIVGSRGDRPTIASPLHKEVYDLESGERLGADGPGLGSYPVRLVDGRLEVLVPQLEAVGEGEIGA